MFRKNKKEVKEFHRSDFGHMSEAEYKPKLEKDLAEMKQRAHQMIDEIGSPFAIVAPQEHGKGVATQVLIGLAGSPEQALILYLGLRSAKEDYIERMSHMLPEEVMEPLLACISGIEEKE